MTRRIIGIHGLANKPREEQLRGWWLDAINEGQGYIESGQVVNGDEFELVYWAGMMYVKPLSVAEPQDSPFYLREPYSRADEATKEYKEGVLDWLRETASDRLDDVLDGIGLLDKVADAILAMKLKDLSVYWDPIRNFRGGRPAKEVLCESVKDVLERNQDHEVMVVAHSMGSIIAYDALTDNPDVQVSTFVTIGSPLGLPRVKRRASKHAGSAWPIVPENVGKWINFADRRDPVAVDTALRQDFLDKAGRAVIEDDLVANDYAFEDADGSKKANYHKSYGYLRCPEVARAIRDFLS